MNSDLERLMLSHGIDSVLVKSISHERGEGKIIARKICFGSDDQPRYLVVKWPGRKTKDGGFGQSYERVKHCVYKVNVFDPSPHFPNAFVLHVRELMSY